MDDVRLIYDDARETWNVYIGAEWYFESKDYERADEVFMNCICPEDEDNYYEEECDEYGY